MANIGLLIKKYETDLAKVLFPENTFWMNSKKDSLSRSETQTQTNYNKEIFGVEGSLTKISDSQLNPAKRTVISSGSYAYDIYVQRTFPTVLTDVDESLANYDKRQSDLEQHTKYLDTKVADFFSYEWLPAKSTYKASKTFKSTGTTTRPSSAPGSTATVKRFLPEDFLQVQKGMMKEELWMPGQNFCLINPEIWEDLQGNDKLIDYNLTGRVDGIAKGWQGEIYGFKIMVRSALPIYSWASGSPVPAGRIQRADTLAQTKNSNVTAANAISGAIFWNSTAVRSAVSSPRVFLNQADADEQADRMSANIFLGGSINHQDDEKGVFVIVEAQ